MNKVLDIFLTTVDPTKQYQELYATYSSALIKLQQQFKLNMLQIQAKQSDQCLQILKKYVGASIIGSEYSVQIEMSSGALPTDRLYICRRGCPDTSCVCFNSEVMLQIGVFCGGEAVAEYQVLYRQNTTQVTKRTIRFAEPTIICEEFAALSIQALEALGIDPVSLEESMADMYRTLVNE